MAAALCAGCTTAPVETVAEAPGRSGQPSQTGTFPNLNIPQRAATNQLSDDETQSKLARLNALQRRQNPGGAATAAAEAERRRLKVAADEQAETLRIIEGQ